jgi:sigma-54-specific transcriptional regulator
VLQEREIVRLGSRHAIPIDVRLVAATNVTLREAVSAGRFREDLFYRLSVAPVRLAPLRERTGDILRLARHFLERHRERLGGSAVELGADAIEALLAHPWPGNVRELENVIHHALLVCQHGRIAERDLGLAPFAPRASAGGAARSDLQALERVLVELFERNLPELHARVEEALVRSAYRFCHQNQLQTARLLGVSRNVVRARLLQYGALPGGPRTSGAGGADDPAVADAAQS